MMPREKFEALVEETLRSLPRRFRRKLHNVAIMVEDWPPEQQKDRMILGLYHGVPFSHRGPFYGNIGPDVIVIYKGPIEALCSSEAAVKERVRKVVLHEIGHYFGMSERQLDDLEEE